ncbi:MULTISPECIES: RDD family protein [Microbulbifer]|uniref:RDD family protein n=1 Tax=Microbulbifer TaxID=48073 RepID=UPI001F22F48D|nr:RDD family protein [Microbulbifer zhoushanensis]
MEMDSCPDFKKYNFQQLQEAYSGVNKDIYPERAREILHRIEQRKRSHPEEVPVPKVGTAGRTERLLAAFLDGLVIMVAFIPVAILVGTKYAENNPVMYPLFLLTYGYLAFLLINSSLLLERGQTVGKKILGISIRDMEGKIPDFDTLIFYRPLLKTAFAVFSPLDVINKLFIFRADKRCIHDHIVQTRVEYFQDGMNGHYKGIRR